MPEPVELAPGLIHHPGWLDAPAQARLCGELALVLRAAPPYRPRMPRTGRPFSVRMSNCGSLGWVSTPEGYRYQATHPETGATWPPIPATARDAWARLTRYPAPPEACLVNLYAGAARMGLHQDRDEEDLEAPVLSLSLGATAVFRYGGPRRGDPTRSLRLASGDALVIGGASRLIHHGIDRLLAAPRTRGSNASTADGAMPDLLRAADADESPAQTASALGQALVALLPEGGRCNLTLRRVTRFAPPPPA